MTIKKVLKKCKFCEKEHLMSTNQIFCSQNCTVLYHRYKKTKKEVFTKKCLWCNSTFLAKRSDDKYCCNNCAKQYRRYKNDKKRNSLKKIKELKTKKCSYCNEEFKTKQFNQRCCSRYCYEKYYSRNVRNKEKARLNARKSYWKNKYKKYAKIYGITEEEYKKITSKCYFCDFNEIVECHHIIPKYKGGKDELSNYIGLCPNHHKLVHLNKYKLIKENEKWKLKKIKKNYVVVK